VGGGDFAGVVNHDLPNASHGDFFVGGGQPHNAWIYHIDVLDDSGVPICTREGGVSFPGVVDSLIELRTGRVLERKVIGGGGRGRGGGGRRSVVFEGAGQGGGSLEGGRGREGGKMLVESAQPTPAPSFPPSSPPSSLPPSQTSMLTCLSPPDLPSSSSSLSSSSSSLSGISNSNSRLVGRLLL